MSTPDRDGMREDVARALDAIGDWWCEGQGVFEEWRNGAPESVRKDREQQEPPLPPLMLWEPK